MPPSPENAPAILAVEKRHRILERPLRQELGVLALEFVAVAHVTARRLLPHRAHVLLGDELGRRRQLDVAAGVIAVAV